MKEKKRCYQIDYLVFHSVASRLFLAAFFLIEISKKMFKILSESARFLAKIYMH
jgi:hypothetical protein